MNWKPADVIALVLSVCLLLFVLMGMANLIVNGQALSEKKAEIIGGLLISIVAVLSVYIGSKIKGDDG